MKGIIEEKKKEADWQQCRLVIKFFFFKLNKQLLPKHLDLILQFFIKKDNENAPIRELDLTIPESNTLLLLN